MRRYKENDIDEADDSKYEKWVIVLKSGNIPIGNISVNGIEKNIIIAM